jgi:opacity protein-like surface antigen
MMMKKTAVALLTGMTLTSMVYAESSPGDRKFIGLEIGAGSVQGDTIGAPNHEGDAVEYGIRLGAQTNEWRTTFLFDYFDSSDDDQNVEKGLLTVDYFFYNSGTEMNVRPFIGVNLGYANYESTFFDDSGFLYGGQAGIVIGITPDIDIDLSYRYSLSEIDVMDHAASFTFGVNYLF